MGQTVSAGGCHCGAVRYEVEGDPLWRTLCFCRSCTHTVGAPLVAWAGFPAERFKVVKGFIKKYQSSAKATRGFCSECGTSLTYEKRMEFEETQAGGSSPEEIYLTVLSFDDPMKYPPEDYVYFEEKAEWLKPGENLPHHGFTRISQKS